MQRPGGPKALDLVRKQHAHSRSPNGEPRMAREVGVHGQPRVLLQRTVASLSQKAPPPWCHAGAREVEMPGKGLQTLQ